MTFILVVALLVGYWTVLWCIGAAIRVFDPKEFASKGVGYTVLFGCAMLFIGLILSLFGLT